MRLKDDLLLRHLGKDHVIIDPGQDMVDMSKVYTLNDTAALIWDAVHGKEFTEETIIDLLLENYVVSPEVAVQDTQRLLNEFKIQNLLAADAC